jgi:hypothetical protein
MRGKAREVDSRLGRTALFFQKMLSCFALGYSNLSGEGEGEGYENSSVREEEEVSERDCLSVMKRLEFSDTIA